jgi:hypothetical protein
MDAGYDYLLMRKRSQQRPYGTIGIFLFIFGITLLACGIAYYDYMATASSGSSGFNFDISETAASEDSLAGETRTVSAAMGVETDFIQQSSKQSHSPQPVEAVNPLLVKTAQATLRDPVTGSL